MTSRWQWRSPIVFWVTRTGRIAPGCECTTSAPAPAWRRRGLAALEGSTSASDRSRMIGKHVSAHMNATVPPASTIDREAASAAFGQPCGQLTGWRVSGHHVGRGRDIRE